MRILNRINKRQSGFTAVELLIGVALIGIIGGAIATTVAQTFSGSSLSSQQMTAINNVKNAVDWITRDTEQARPKESAPGSGELFAATPPDDTITLIWYDYTNYPTKQWYRVTYTIPSGTKNLQRTLDVGDYSTGTWTSGQPIIVAQNITSVTRQFNDCVWSAEPNPICLKVVKTLTISITSTVDTVEEKRTLEIVFRPTK